MPLSCTKDRRTRALLNVADWLIRIYVYVSASVGSEDDAGVSNIFSSQENCPDCVAYAQRWCLLYNGKPVGRPPSSHQRDLLHISRLLYQWEQSVNRTCDVSPTRIPIRIGCSFTLRSCRDSRYGILSQECECVSHEDNVLWMSTPFLRELSRMYCIYYPLINAIVTSYYWILLNTGHTISNLRCRVDHQRSAQGVLQTSYGWKSESELKW